MASRRPPLAWSGLFWEPRDATVNEQLTSLLALPLGVAVLFGGLALVTMRRDRARKSALLDLAERLGWTLDDSTPDLAWRLTRTLRGRTARKA